MTVHAPSLAPVTDVSASWLAALPPRVFLTVLLVLVVLKVLGEARHELGWEVASQKDIYRRVEQETWGVRDALRAGDPPAEELAHELEGGWAGDQKKQNHVNQNLGQHLLFTHFLNYSSFFSS